MRIVSLCPSNTEILFALGLGTQVVGVDDWSDWPEGALEGLPRVGGDLNSDIDKVAALRPDLVVASLSVPGMERNVEGLQARGLPRLVLNPHSVDDVLGDIVAVGDACGARDAAAALVAELRGRIETVRGRTRLKADMSDSPTVLSALAEPGVASYGEARQGPGEGGRESDGATGTARGASAARPRVYWEWWPKPLIAAGRASWVQQLSEWVGAANVFTDIEQPSRPVTDADVIARDPDVLMICWCGTLQRLQDASCVVSRPGWDRVSGVKRGRVHCVPEALFGRPSQRLVDGLEMLERLLSHDS